MLHGAAACVEAVATLPLLPAEVVRVANERDRADRAHRHKRGIRDHSGLPVLNRPPALWPLCRRCLRLWGR